MRNSVCLGLALACLLVTGCSENGGQPPSAKTAGGVQPVTDAAEPAVAAPAVPAFAPSSEEQNALAARVNAGRCSVDNIQVFPDGQVLSQDTPGTYKVGRDGSYRVVGFVVDIDKGTVPSEFRLVLAGNKTYEMKSTTGGPRGDVAESLKNPSFATSGFDQEVSFAGMDPGTYALYILSGEGEGSAICTTFQGLIVQ